MRQNVQNGVTLWPVWGHRGIGIGVAFLTTRLTDFVLRKERSHVRQCADASPLLRRTCGAGFVGLAACAVGDAVLGQRTRH